MRTSNRRRLVGFAATLAALGLFVALLGRAGAVPPPVRVETPARAPSTPEVSAAETAEASPAALEPTPARKKPGKGTRHR